MTAKHRLLTIVDTKEILRTPKGPLACAQKTVTCVQDNHLVQTSYYLVGQRYLVHLRVKKNLLSKF